MLEVDFKYYENIYEGSSIPSKSFKKVIKEAINRVNRYTSHRVNSENVTNDIKNTACEIAEFLYSQETLKEKIISEAEKIVSSETVGPHSISFENKSNQIQSQILNDKDLERICYEICYRNIVHTGLMYRGR